MVTVGFRIALLVGTFAGAFLALLRDGVRFFDALSAKTLPGSFGATGGVHNSQKFVYIYPIFYGLREVGVGDGRAHHTPRNRSTLGASP